MEFKLDSKRAIRSAYGEALQELGAENPTMVVLDADLSCSTKTSMFAEKYPDRFFNVGVAEQNMMSMAAGFAIEGRLVFASTFAMFGAGRAWEQVRNSIAYDNLNVKVVLTHAGLTVGKDGASHQIIEDLSLMRVIPNMRIFVPCDFSETKAVIKHAAKMTGPVYVRLCRENMLDIYPDDYEFDFSTPNTLIEGSDVTIFSCGYMVAESIKAAQELAREEISAQVVDMHTIKLMDVESVVNSAKNTGAIVTAEEHSIFGGLGSGVAEILSESYPTPMKRVGVMDKFGVSGPAPKLMQAYNLTSQDIVNACREVIARKKTV
ncbi:MAG TPA: transketolase family protein [Candidatus Altiarchaeales archaeon]|nr:transketolase family protein [Candidatus Altiarchaeales archaeon]